ncbi:MAG: PAS domain S-box protein, partial [Deltaproteobacteria bacterium]|nr:PAS domain S-box protein [Deltaproteobacteria bacterium]
MTDKLTNERLRKKVARLERQTAALKYRLKRAEASEKKYRGLLENSDHLVFSTDKEGNINYISSAIEPLLGYTPQYLTGRRFSNFVHPTDFTRIQKNHENVLSGRSISAEYQIVDKYDQVHWVKISSRLILNNDRSQDILWVLTDITDHKQLEKALRDSEEKYRHLYDTAVVGMFRIEIKTGCVLELNEACARLFGYGSRDEILTHQMGIEIHVSREIRRNLASKLKKYGKIDSAVAELRQRDGSPIRVELTIQMYLDAGFIE